MAAPERRRRVLWLAKGLGPGGMERLLVNHARFGDRDRFEYRAAYIVERPNSVVPELVRLGVPVTRLDASIAGVPIWPLQLRRLVLSERVDIVHTHSPLPAALARPLLRLGRNRPQLVYTEHNTWDCYGTATRWANLATYVLDDHQFAVSDDAAASPPARLADRVEVLTHGIDLDAVGAHRMHRDRVRESLGVGPSTTVIATVANLRVEKGYDVLFDAAPVVLRRHRDVVFLCIGQGPLESELRARHAREGFGDRVRLLGFRADALDLMAAADVFCLSSRQEGLPVAYMESVALGLPSVVTSVGGLVGAVVDGETGVVVPPERSDRLADGLIGLIEDPERCSTMSTAALGTAKRFDARAAIARQEQVYAELVP